MLQLEHSGNFRNLFLSFPAKPGLPTAPSTLPVKLGLPTAPSTVPAKPGLPTAVPAKPGLPQPPSAVPATRNHHRDCLPLSSTRRSSQPPGTITGTACLFPVPKKLPATRDHHRACLSSVNIHWIFIHSNWKHHD